MKNAALTFAHCGILCSLDLGYFSFLEEGIVGLMWTYGGGFGSVVGQGEKFWCWLWWCYWRCCKSVAVGALEERKFEDE